MRAKEWLVPCVDPSVASHRCVVAEALRTVFTGKRSLPGVQALVLYKARFQRKRLA